MLPQPEITITHRGHVIEIYHGIDFPAFYEGIVTINGVEHGLQSMDLSQLVKTLQGIIDHKTKLHTFSERVIPSDICEAAQKVCDFFKIYGDDLTNRFKKCELAHEKPSKADPQSDRQAQEGTPRTDAELAKLRRDAVFPYFVPTRFARTLERELAASLAATQRAQEELAKLQTKNANMVEAGRQGGEHFNRLMAERDKLKIERDGALHSSESWELLHAKRQEELAAMTRERDEAQQPEFVQEYILAGERVKSLETSLRDAENVIRVKDDALSKTENALAAMTKERDAVQVSFEYWHKQSIGWMRKYNEVSYQAATATEQLNTEKKRYNFVLQTADAAESRARTAEAAVAFAVQSVHEIGRLVISLSTSRDVGDLPKAEASERCILNLCHGICATDCGTALLAELGKAKKDTERLKAKLNSPELLSFRDGVVLEAAHQRERWPSDHDAGKEPQDWFWLLGYLAGKALKSHASGDTDKALHHTISSGAALANWHAAILGKTDMRPGLSQEKHDAIDAVIAQKESK